MIKIEKEKPAKEALTLFSVEIVLTPSAEGGVQANANVKGHKAEMMALLIEMGINPGEYRSIMRNAAKATVRELAQQVVNLSESLESAEIKEMED